MRVLCFALLAFAFTTYSVNASIVSQFGLGEVTTISDDSAEFLINKDGSLSTGGDSFVDIGDAIVAIAEIQTLEIGGGGPVPFGNEFTALIALEITGKTGGLGGPATFTAGPISATSLANITGVTPGIGAVLSTAATGTMIQFFDGGAVDNFDRAAPPASLDALAATATDGTAIFEAGYLGLAGEYYNISSLSDDISVVGSIPGPTGGGTFSFGLNETANNNSGVRFDPIPNYDIATLTAGASDFVGAGLLFAPTTGVTTPFDTYNNFEASFLADIPEPTSACIWGLIAIAAGSVGSHRRQK